MCVFCGRPKALQVGDAQMRSNRASVPQSTYLDESVKERVYLVLGDLLQYRASLRPKEKAHLVLEDLQAKSSSLFLGKETQLVLDDAITELTQHHHIAASQSNSFEGNPNTKTMLDVDDMLGKRPLLDPDRRHSLCWICLRAECLAC